MLFFLMKYKLLYTKAVFPKIEAVSDLSPGPHA